MNGDYVILRGTWDNGEQLSHAVCKGKPEPDDGGKTDKKQIKTGMHVYGLST